MMSLFLFMPVTVEAKQKVTVKSETCSGPHVAISIKEARYINLDNDNLEDDVMATVQLDILCSNRVNFEYYITLTLPSGRSFTYAYMINTRLNTLTLDNYFYNHAIERGDYKIDVEILLKTGGISYGHNDVIFDPPGGTDADPYFLLNY